MRRYFFLFAPLHEAFQEIPRHQTAATEHSRRHFTACNHLFQGTDADAEHPRGFGAADEPRTFTQGDGIVSSNIGSHQRRLRRMEGNPAHTKQIILEGFCVRSESHYPEDIARRAIVGSKARSVQRCGG
jgi:hypothetical protein